MPQRKMFTQNIRDWYKKGLSFLEIIIILLILMIMAAIIIRVYGGTLLPAFKSTKQSINQTTVGIGEKVNETVGGGSSTSCSIELKDITKNNDGKCVINLKLTGTTSGTVTIKSNDKPEAECTVSDDGTCTAEITAPADGKETNITITKDNCQSICIVINSTCGKTGEC